MGRPKHQIVLGDGRALGQVAVDALWAAGADEVVLVGAAIASGQWASALRHIPDTRPGQGPLAAIEALLSTGLARTWLICACDMPLLEGPLLHRLVHAGHSPLAIFEGPPGATIQPLPLRIDLELLPTVRELLEGGRRSLRSLIDAAATLRVPAACESLLEDLDTPDDLDSFEARHVKRHRS